jgi:glycosyltransferase involved in cell wall biosynthesis
MTVTTYSQASDRLRVLVITKSTGGLKTYNTRMCQYIDRNHFDLEVMCLSENREEYAAELREMGLTAYTMDMERYAINPAEDWKLSRKLSQHVREHGYDVLLGHGSKAGFLARLVGRMTKVPALYGMHSMSFVPRIFGKKAYTYYVLELVGRAIGGHVVVLSNATREVLLRLGIASDKNISIVYTGIEEDRFKKKISREQACQQLNLDPANPVIGWAARFEVQKAPLEFVKAMARVVEQVPDVQIFMAGEGSLRDEAIALAKTLGIDGNFLFAPWQSDVPDMLTAFDVYVLNSRWEGLPQSLLEAMAMECACVTTSVDGNVEVIQDGKNGYLVAPEDAEALSQRIIALLEDDDLRQQISRAGRERVLEQFTVQLMMETYQDVFRQQAQRKPTPQPV